MSSILERAKEAYRKKKQEKLEQEQKQKQIQDSDIQEENIESESESVEFEDDFELFDKKWVLAPFMDEISEGDLTKVPIECIFTHYILRYSYHCLYIALDDHETGNDFEVYEFDYIEPQEDHGEKFDPDFNVVEESLDAAECGKFLAERIKEGYKIYIEERKEFGE